VSKIPALSGDLGSFAKFHQGTSNPRQCSEGGPPVGPPVFYISFLATLSLILYPYVFSKNETNSLLIQPMEPTPLEVVQVTKRNDALA
jgi:hypothetical protein